jgi:hypothetical protein
LKEIKIQKLDFSQFPLEKICKIPFPCPLTTLSGNKANFGTGTKEYKKFMKR